MQDLNRVLNHLKRKAKGNIFRLLLLAVTMIICVFMFLGDRKKDDGDLKITTKKEVSAESADGKSDGTNAGDGKVSSSIDNGENETENSGDSKLSGVSDDNIGVNSSDGGNESTSSDEDSSMDGKGTSAPDKLCVYVCGAVVNEGVYELPPDSRVSDALRMAGGYSDEALKGYVNLAEKLNDGERIYIPNKIEIDDLNILIDQDASASKGASKGASEEGTETGSKSNEDDMVNINTADAATLQTLPGIGETKATEIIAYRDEHGAFGSVEDIKNVSGIGEGTFSRISSRIKVE